MNLKLLMMQRQSITFLLESNKRLIAKSAISLLYYSQRLIMTF